MRMPLREQFLEHVMNDNVLHHSLSEGNVPFLARLRTIEIRTWSVVRHTVSTLFVKGKVGSQLVVYAVD